MESPLTKHRRNSSFDQERQRGKFRSLRSLLKDGDGEYESDMVAEISKLTNTLITTSKNRPRKPNGKHRKPRPSKHGKAKSVGPVRRHNYNPSLDQLIPRKTLEDDDGYASEPADGPGI